MAENETQSAEPPAHPTTGEPPPVTKKSKEAADAPKEASEDDVVLHYVGKNKTTITTGYGGLPPRDLTRAETRTLIRTKAWLRGVMESGVYESVEGTLIQLPDDTEDAAG